MLFKSFGAVVIGVISFFSVRLLFSKLPLTEKFDADYDYIIGIYFIFIVIFNVPSWVRASKENFHFYALYIDE